MGCGGGGVVEQRGIALFPLSRQKWYRSFFKKEYIGDHLFPLIYTSRNAEETIEFKNENKKCSQGIWENSTKYII